MNERDLFTAALGRLDADRAAFLDGACAGDSRLRAQVEELLREHDQLGSFLEPPPRALVATVDEPVRERPGTVIGPYKLLEQIGEGGFGVVFMAEQHQPLRRKVALKVLKPGMDTRQVVARFEAERQALALMDHPNIAHVFDGGETASGRPYFVMELVRGIPITDFCDQNHLSVRARLELFIHICQAVQHAHQKGIIHRDLKPSNVLVTLHDSVPVLKVIDFGVAKATGQQLTDKTLFTNFAQMIGTPMYMSPEQAQMSGLDVDTRTDVYALGVLLYELLTGTTPFDRARLRAAGYDEMRRIIREEEPARPSTRMSTLGQATATVCANRGSDPRRLRQLMRGELDWIVLKALEKDRNRRYETASAFAADVQRHLNDEPVQACPPSRWYRFRKFSRRNKAVLGTAAALALAALVAAGSLAVSNARISGEAEEKAKALDAATTSEREAMASLKDALAAVDQMLTRVSQERLHDTPRMEPVRRDLLEDALKFYQKFLERRGSDPAIRREVGLAYLRTGGLHYRLGDYRKSEDAFRKGFAMLDELEAETPLEPAVRTKLIAQHIESSWAYENQGKYEEREKALRRAVAVAEGLRKEFPEVAPYRDWLADARNRLATVIGVANPGEAEELLRHNLALTENTDSPWHRAQTYQSLGVFLLNHRNLAEAEEACREAVKFFEKALAKPGSNHWQKGDLATALTHLARAVDANGKPEEADRIYQRAIPEIDRFAADFPSGPHCRWGQMRVHFLHAALLLRLKKLPEAEKAYRLTAELAETLAVDFPTLQGYQETAVSRRLDLANFLVETGRAPEGRQVADVATRRMEGLTGSERSKAFKARGDFYAGLGEWDRAAADLAQAIETGSDDVLGVWYPLAVLHLQAGRDADYRSLCERLLGRFENRPDLWVVITCKLAPNAVADLSRPVRLAEKLVARDPRSAEYVGMLGATLYRRGDLKAAALKLEESIRSGPRQIGVHWRRLVLAMAYHRLGRGAEARQLFQEVTRWMDENIPESRDGGASPRVPLSWAHRLDMRLLHREAAEVLKQDYSNKTPKSQK